MGQGHGDLRAAKHSLQAAHDVKMADQAEKDKDLSEDERDKVKEDIQDLTKQYETQAADLAKAREKDVMED